MSSVFTSGEATCLLAYMRV